ncbi:uncharacterized protein LOC105183780 [Harpegnathos saltator]|uniref:uncharacterized protein LOC105183780 n=1 Tax=Harpegnathos saltator TaxID=610380 RepID=UPI000590F8D7|nr:uncharacterized protein LOC105183780 [Harpegnathos saltator]
MGYDSSFGTGRVMLFIIYLSLLAVTRSSAHPIDYEDAANLLPTEPRTTNDTLAVIVQDPVVQDAVQNTVGNGSLEGLVVKKRIFIMPATAPTKVMSQSEQVLVVPVTNLEDVRKNITGGANEERDDSAFADTRPFTMDTDGEKEFYGNENNPADTSQRVGIYETLDELSETTRKPYLPVDDDKTSRETPLHLMPDPRKEMKRPAYYQDQHHRASTTISVPIIALFDPAKISDDKVDVPIAAALSQADDISESRMDLLENERDEIQRNVQDYIDGNSWSVDPDYWRLMSSDAQTPLLYESATTENQYVSDVRPEISLPVAVPRVDIVTPLFWTSDADVDYPKDSRDMDTAAHIAFRPLFRLRQEEQRRSWRRGTDSDYRRLSYRRYNSYNPYPRRGYRYSRYS